MIEFMDGVVEAVEQFCREVEEYALIILKILVTIALYITVPVWMLPYKAIRKMWKQRERSKEDAGNND